MSFHIEFHQPASVYQDCTIKHSESSKATYPLSCDDSLESYTGLTAQQCLDVFLTKGGTFQYIPCITGIQEPQIHLNIGDAVYPICSGGWCRSQSTWAMLQPYSDKILLFAPHAARYGWDPYNGKINRSINYAEEIEDEFPLYFGMHKAVRFGFENTAEWNSIAASPTDEGLKKITDFYNEHYFGANSSQLEGRHRIYIVFSINAHVVLHRLNRANHNLEDVTLIAIDSEDILTDPPAFLNTASRSSEAYGYFSSLLLNLFDFSGIH